MSTHENAFYEARSAKNAPLGSVTVNFQNGFKYSVPGLARARSICAKANKGIPPLVAIEMADQELLNANMEVE